MDYELIIIGAGPAAMSASIYASRYKINHLLIGEIPGGLMSEAHKICNYPSEIEISGMELMMKMKAHVEHLGASIVYAKVEEIKKEGDVFVVKAQGKEYKAKTILGATGMTHRKLDLPREKELLGKGVSYCATCDAMFFKNKDVAVIGGGNSAMTAALYLAEVANKVYQIIRGTELKGEMIWQEQLKSNPKVELIFENNVGELLGEGKLEAIKLNQEYQGQSELRIDGLFVEVGSIPNTALFESLGAQKNEAGYLIIDGAQKTSVPGLWAAGDLTSGSNHLHQIITACSEGSIAAGDIFNYLKSEKAKC